MRKRIVQRLRRDESVSDFVAAIDIIEVYLGVGTGEPSMSERLDAVLAQIRNDAAMEEAAVEVLVDAVGRLRKIEVFLADFWRSC